MIKPGQYNFVAYQGVTLRKTFLWKQPNGDPVDLTGYTGRCQFRTAKDAKGPPVLDLTTINGGFIITALEGKITLLATAEQMELSNEKLMYDIELLDTLGDTIRLIEGCATLSKGVTRAVALTPSNTALPVITGTTTVGSTLACSDGSWSNTPLSYGKQWKRNGVAISGAYGSSYLLVSGDLGMVITCTVTALNAAGSTPVTSAPTATIT